MERLITVTNFDHRYPSASLSSRPGVTTHQASGPRAVSQHHQDLRRLLLLHLESEIQRLTVWSNPLEDTRRGVDPLTNHLKSLPPVRFCSKQIPDDRVADALFCYLQTAWTQYVQSAWNHSPRLAVLMTQRFKDASVTEEVARLVRQDPAKAADVPEALEFFLGTHLGAKTRQQLRVSSSRTHRRTGSDTCHALSASRVLGAGVASLSFALLPSRFQYRTSYRSVCYAHVGTASHRLGLLLHSASGTGAANGPSE